MTVDEHLGYVGSRRFENAAHACRCLKPSQEVLDHLPAKTVRIKALARLLRVDDCSLLRKRADVGVFERAPPTMLTEVAV